MFHKPEENLKCVICLAEKEEELTRECPGRPLTNEEKERVRDKLLDYYDDKWKTFVKLY